MNLRHGRHAGLLLFAVTVTADGAQGTAAPRTASSAEPTGETAVTLERSTIGGGGVAAGGAFAAVLTVGDVGGAPIPLSGGDFSAEGGFWGSAPSGMAEVVFSDGFEASFE